MLYIPEATREELEAAIIENQIIPRHEIRGKGDDELRAIVTDWIAADDECSES